VLIMWFETHLLSTVLSPIVDRTWEEWTHRATHLHGALGWAGPCSKCFLGACQPVQPAHFSSVLKVRKLRCRTRYAWGSGSPLAPELVPSLSFSPLCVWYRRERIPLHFKNVFITRPNW
jgi:hypothetical protein